ncbi:MULTISPECIES: family 20 glycosylhydrolase [unclassified Thermosipho (in: thermotogales)]|uniref:beta-N-acetylhexosaminidase n=1 Tax=unclassified Thermosipho (in: thermotogales) TaxID=2676525 RepID=UPI000985C263|nr:MULTISPECIES: family 20 glycosylhydrolase [unclassified Thermosipho (in: thermotogales)]MBT1247600.1 glycoside hydrolase [Thermosipho sp. 1244]OOC46164.1 glycoside hydrolase [Thermosipho sp. 1223]
MLLVPNPKELKIKNGYYEIKSGGYIFIPTKSLFSSANMVKELLNKNGITVNITLYMGRKVFIYSKIDRNKIKKRDGYILEINKDGIFIVANNNAGIHNGFMTFMQIVKNFENKIPFLEIKDWPDIENRAFMLDISRDKVPKMDFFFELIDLLAQLKYNQLQLYIEHTFAYQNHERVWKEYSPLTADEIIILDKYCKERFIELIPNQASFGHMEKWLIHNEYSYMAETFEFDTPWGEHYSKPFTLSPAVKDTILFLDSLYSELLPHFSSKYFNINGDETFDLCQGKSKVLCEKYGKGKVYLDFILKIHKLVKKHGKRMMMWADILKYHPELFEKLPKDVIYLIWGYEKTHEFDRECELFKGFDFYVCPGTSSWNSFLGRVENAILNIKNAVENGLKYKAKGIMLADWGDNGHWQHIPISYPGIFYASALSWGFNENKDLDVFDFLKLYFGKETAILLVDMGNAYKLTDVDFPNSTIFALVYIYPEKLRYEFLKDLDLEKLLNTKKFLEEKYEFTKHVHDELIKKELRNSIKFSILSLEIIIALKKLAMRTIRELPKVTKQEFKIRLEKLISEFKEIWLSRNRIGGLKFSVQKLEKIKKFFE